MKRRKFIKLTSTASAMGLLPIQLKASLNFLNNFSNCNFLGRKIVLIELKGGNDGLNTIIPINVYDEYMDLRPTTHIPISSLNFLNSIDPSILGTNQDIAFHPALSGMFNLFSEGQLRIIQSVGYPNSNKSHFASIDIYNTGNDGNNWNNGQSSGWIGRFLENHYQNLLPNNYPMGIQIGSTNTSLGFHGEKEHGLAVNLSGQDSENFYSILSGLAGEYPNNFPSSDYGTELQYIVNTDRVSNIYAQAISDSFNAGSNYHGANYPDNDLANQLKTVARLIRGGIQTKVYLVRIGGFDTHNNQVQGIGDIQGKHYNLLDELSTALEAFSKDLNSDSIGDDVVGITISEFGRKAKENGSLGTDHGEVAPVFVFGKPIMGGISGVNVDLSEATEDNNFQIETVQFDYRQTLATIMQDFLASDNLSIDNTFKDNLNSSSFINAKIQNLLKPSYIVPENCYNVNLENDPKYWEIFPNPFEEFFNVIVLSDNTNENSEYNMVNQNGQIVKKGNLIFNSGAAQVHLPNLKAGLYTLTVKNSTASQSFKLIGGVI